MAGENAETAGGMAPSERMKLRAGSCAPFPEIDELANEIDSRIFARFLRSRWRNPVQQAEEDA